MTIVTAIIAKNAVHPTVCTTVTTVFSFFDKGYGGRVVVVDSPGAGSQTVVSSNSTTSVASSSKSDVVGTGLFRVSSVAVDEADPSEFSF